MDAAEADADVKLYKASAELLLDLQAKVPRLVQDPKNQGAFRKWIIDSKTYEVTRLLDSFQEWPQLLDPYLARLIQILVEAYLFYCVTSPNEYVRAHDVQDQVSPSPRAIARVLYAFCKVRGQKVIVRLLNNEPKYVEPLLSCFRLWTSTPNTRTSGLTPTMTWEERYIHLLWLSHLMLAPFELSTISVLSVDKDAEHIFPELYSNLPNVSVNLAIAGLNNLDVSSKAREAASTLLVRLSLRGDMQRLGLTERLISWICRELQSSTDQTKVTGYRHIGLLALLFGITNIASDAEVAPYLKQIFVVVYNAATSTSKHFESIRDSAPARKLLVKVMRSVIVHAISIKETGVSSGFDIDLDHMLEDCIQTLLDFLADKDTPVRQASSKALSLICLRLDSTMSSEVVEAVIDSLNENMLLEDIDSGALFPVTDVLRGSSSKHKKNLNAVDPLKWHGCMLTLGHLLFRRSLPSPLLPAVIDALLMGLDFEQRSNAGTSVGVGVRDAACFGIWSLARKFSTTELNQIILPNSLLPYPDTFSGTAAPSTLQLLANHLAISACLDPSGNLRRGSSAALQELIGRHPDVIAQGIPVVQTIDYHAVARRSRAVTEVAIAASELSPHYCGALLYALLGWRGVRATDADSRRLAAQAAGMLMANVSEKDGLQYLEKLLHQIKHLKPANTGSNASARHGLMSCLAAIIDHTSRVWADDRSMRIFNVVKPVLENLTPVIGSIESRVTMDVENVLESTSKTILAYAKFVFALVMQKLVVSVYPTQWVKLVETILNQCTVLSDKDLVTEAAAQANTGVFLLRDVGSQKSLLDSWLNPKEQSKAEFTCKGRTTSLGHIFRYVHTNQELRQQYEQRIVMYLNNIVSSPYAIEIKVNAVQSIAYILRTAEEIGSKQLKILLATIYLGLTDYTVDQRGDIGSLLRLESIEAAQAIAFPKLDMDQRQRISQLLVRLAAERIVKVRFQAWKCLKKCLEAESISLRIFEHQADVSSFEYFRTLNELLQHPRYCKSLIAGLVSSLSGGTEDLYRACSESLVLYIQDQPEEVQPQLLHSIVECAAEFLTSLTPTDDFEVVAAIDFLAFLVEHVLIYQRKADTTKTSEHIWSLCQKVHTASSTLIRLEAMVRLYATLVLLEQYRLHAIDKLTRMLLHRWPKVRNAAADVLFLTTDSASLQTCDWNLPAAQNKPLVVALRKELNVTGATETKFPHSSVSVAQLVGKQY